MTNQELLRERRQLLRDIAALERGGRSAGCELAFERAQTQSRTEAWRAARNRIAVIDAELESRRCSS
jgi:hypothetical protein